MQVPFLDIKAQDKSIQDEILNNIKKVIDQNAFAGGSFVLEFEKGFASFCNSEHAIGVGSGTAALWMALLGLDIGQGDEVITVSNTFIATAEAITFCGATPVFIDIDEKYHTMDPLLLENAITPKTKAIIPVHLYGQMADMDPIMEIARKHGLYVIEDACQAHGAKYKGKRAGSIGDAGCFSFYPGKNLGAYGEAGAITTSNDKLAEKLRMFRDHGQNKKYYHSIIGWNARMDGLQGAVLDVKLRSLSTWTEARRKNGQLYTKLLTEINNVITPAEANYAKHVYHVYPICVQNRDNLLQNLLQENIFCGIHYPVPVHLQKAYSFLNNEHGSLPITEKVTPTLLSLPMHPTLSEEQIRYVVEKIQLYFSN